MSPLQVLVLPDALRSPNQGHILPDCPVLGSRTVPRRNHGELCHPFVGNLSLTTLMLSVILFRTRCALCHCLLHSRPPPLSFPLTHVDYLSLFCSLAAFPSLVNSSFSQLSPLSAHSLCLPCVVSLHLDCCSSSRSLFLSHYLPF